MPSSRGPWHFLKYQVKRSSNPIDPLQEWLSSCHLHLLAQRPLFPECLSWKEAIHNGVYRFPKSGTG